MRKLMIIGHSGHGKDTVASMLSQIRPYRYIPASLYVAKNIIFPQMKDKYANFIDCFEDRRNHRALWYNMIQEYTKNDSIRLIREFYQPFDIYTGCRDSVSLQKAKKEKLIDKVIWIEASKRLPLEDESSMKISHSDADYILYNNDKHLYSLRNNVNQMIIELTL